MKTYGETKGNVIFEDLWTTRSKGYYGTGSRGVARCRKKDKKLLHRRARRTFVLPVEDPEPDELTWLHQDQVQYDYWLNLSYLYEARRRGIPVENDYINWRYAKNSERLPR